MTDISRANHAKQLLSDPLLIEVLDEIELAAFKAWASTGLADTDGRERVWHSYKAAGRIRTVLQGLVDDGLIQASRAVAPR